MTPVLSVVCNEPKGAVERHVYPLQLTVENLQKFWEKSRKYKTLFTYEIKDDFKRFLSVFLEGEAGNVKGKGLLWVVDDFVGVFYITDIDVYRGDAIVHFTFFDGRIRGRDVLAKKMLEHVFETYSFRRLTAHAPTFMNEASKKFIEHIGFRKEGEKRESSYYDGVWFNTLQYGILSKEVIRNGAKA